MKLNPIKINNCSYCDEQPYRNIDENMLAKHEYDGKIIIKCNRCEAIVRNNNLINRNVIPRIVQAWNLINTEAKK